jgi:hypothetical protein
MNLTPRSAVIAGLGVLLAAQVGFLGKRTFGGSDAPRAAPFVQMGDSVGVLTGLDEAGESWTIDWGSKPDDWTLVLSFNSACDACDQLASSWRDWLKQLPADRVVLATSDSIAEAARYVSEHEWPGRVLSLTTPSTTADNLKLLRKLHGGRGTGGVGRSAVWRLAGATSLGPASTSIRGSSLHGLE